LLLTTSVNKQADDVDTFQLLLKSDFSVQSTYESGHKNELKLARPEAVEQL
jgi:hypothetical protein